MPFKPKFGAVIFDLDGVITKTALVHASAWKKMFDDYMISREKRFGESFREFTHSGDYLPYVDGKPRYKGVASFLESRGIDIPFGEPGDEPDRETVCGLGNRKNIMFNEVLEEQGVEVYESSVQMIEKLKKAGVRIGVASSSKNCGPVLEKAGLLHFFETRVDGVVSAEIGLKGKPEPDIFSTACDNLGIEYHRAVVVEDAVSGVQAGRKGNFGFVLGIAREQNTEELLAGGADVVVEDLGEISLQDLNEWFGKGIEADGWVLRYHDYNLESERSREALLAVGNGYFGTRGALEESAANEVNYPGTYFSGLFNRLYSKVGGREIENEDFVNAINWLPVTFRIDGGPWLEFSPESNFRIIKIRRELRMKGGELLREMIVEDEQGRRTRITSCRFAGMADPHRAGLKYRITPMNYSGTIECRSELRGDHRNAGVKRYNDLNQQHLEPVTEAAAGHTMELAVKTTRSDILIAACATTRVTGHRAESGPGVRKGPGWVSQEYKVQGEEGKTIVVEKLVSLFTSRDPGIEDPLYEARETIGNMNTYASELSLSSGRWMELWQQMDVQITGDREAQKLVRLHLFHLMVTASPHHAGLDSGIPPRGLHGEAYRGHIFWDELYILPLLNLHFQDVVRSVLMYRYRRIDAARAYAKEYGYQGAMYPWQSGSDGREETQIIHLNPLSGEWGDDYSSLQRHISLAIAYNLWGYYHASGDLEFMSSYGAEVFLDICKFWASKAVYSESDDRFHIDRVMGPDEFHEKLPGSQEGGLTDNAYSNVMVSWMLGRAFQLFEDIEESERERIMEILSLSVEDLKRWDQIMRGLAIHLNREGVVEQFMGYFDLKELDWDHYRKQYDDIHRLDRILKAEGKSPDDFKLSKQADFLMSFYNLGNEEVTKILQLLGVEIPDHFQKANFNYYIQRTSHGSTLSRLVHGRLAWKMGLKELGWSLFMDALRSDLVDIQGGTTGEGIHCGVMAGTVYETISTYGGLDLMGETPSVAPALPDHWKALNYNFMFRGNQYQVTVTGKEVKISLENGGKDKIKVHLYGKDVELSQDEPVSLPLN